MKRIFLPILILSMCCNIAVYGIYDDEIEVAKAVLGSDGLKLVDETYFTKDGITRAKVAEIIYKLNNISPHANYVSSKIEPLFNDVPNEYWAFDYIMFLAGYGIVSGDGTGKFRPDDFCTYAELIKMLICSMEWEALAVINLPNNEYPYGYYLATQDLGMDIKIKDINKIITKDDFFYVLYRALNTHSASIYYTVPRHRYSYAPNFFERNNNIFRTVGYAQRVNESIIQIGDNFYVGNVYGKDDFQEGYALCYYTKDKDNNGRVKNNMIAICLELSDNYYNQHKDDYTIESYPIHNSKWKRSDDTYDFMHIVPLLKAGIDPSELGAYIEF